MKRIKPETHYTLIAFGLASLWAANTEAATISAASCSSSDVSSAVSRAVNGDAVTIPAGSCSWPSNISINSKAITVQGAGAGKTIISSGTFTISNAASRVSGFTFNIGTAGGFVVEGASRGFRIDHNTITRSDYGAWFTAYGQYGTNRLKGLIDNNDITRGRLVHYGEDSSTGGRYTWSSPLGLGTDDAIFVEDNTITFPDGSAGGTYLNTTDGNMGCRLVIRYNKINGGRFESHGLQSENSRACMLWEYYRNTITNPATPNYRPFLIRGGTGMVFQNTTDGRFMTNDIYIDNLRSHQAEVYSGMSSWGACNGSSWVDGNSSGGGEGYLCRDQIGASQDASLWNYSNPAPAQAKVPAYIWKNTRTDNGSELKVTLNCVGTPTECTRQSTKQIVLNRDYFTYNSSFNGSSGVGQGPLANRPATCTPGVAYWATDDGEWDSKNAGSDGQLYKCTAPNTWTAYYKPFAYPHPLQGGSSGIATLNPPTNLRIQ
jgi:hypothetical protein